MKEEIETERKDRKTKIEMRDRIATNRQTHRQTNMR